MTEPHQTNTRELAGTLAVVVLFAVAIVGSIAIVNGSNADRNDKQTRQRTEKNTKYLNDNDHKLTIVGNYTEHDNKGRTIGTIIIAQGTTTKERTTLKAAPKYPATGETWKAELDKEGRITLTEQHK